MAGALPPELVSHIVACLSEPEATLVARTLCRAARAHAPPLPNPIDVREPLPTWVVELCLSDCAGREGVVRALAASGVVAHVALARARGLAWDDGTATAAAEGGHLALLQWLRAQDPPCPWDAYPCASTCIAAVERGDLAMLQWLRAQDPPCPWDANVGHEAAWGGHLAILQWMRAQDGWEEAWDPCACHNAINGRGLEVLRWMVSLDQPGASEEWDEVCLYAASQCDLAALQCLRSRDPPCPWNARECANRAREEGRARARDVLDWLAAQGVYPDSDVETGSWVAGGDDSEGTSSVGDASDWSDDDDSDGTA